MDHPNHSSKHTVLEAITKGEVTPRSRRYFVIKKLILISGVVIFALLSVFFGSFIIFSLRQNGGWFAPQLGTIIASIPWLFVITVMIFLVLLNLLLHHYRFAYRRPLVYTITLVSLGFLISTALLARLRVHEYIMEHARVNATPVIQPLYVEHRGLPHPETITLGMVTTTEETGVEIISPNREFFQVRLTPKTQRGQTAELRPGQVILVFGKKRGNVIIAEGIKRIRSEDGVPLPRWQQ